MPGTEVKGGLESKSRVTQRADFDEIFTQYEAPVYRYCCRLCGGNRSDAEDLAQETWLLAWRNLHQFAGRAPIKTWLYQIAFRRWMQLRAAGRESVPLDQVSPAMAQVEPHRQHDFHLCLDAAIGRLSPAQREAFVLVKAEGLTHKEAAEVLGVPQGTVQFRVHEAIRKLRIELAGLSPLLVAWPADRLDEVVRSWRDETPPSGFTDRVQAALDSTPAGSVEAVPAIGRQPAATSARPVGKQVAAAGVMLVLVGVGTVFTVRRRPAGAPRPPSIVSTLRSLEAVQTAHATGTSEVVAGGNGTPRVTTRYQLDIWFKAPGHYRRRAIPRGQPTLEQNQFLDGSRGMTTRVLGTGRLLTTRIEGAPSARDFGALSLFTRENELVRRLRNGEASISTVRTEDLNREAIRIEISLVRIGQPQHWVLFVDPRNHRPFRLEYRRETWQREGWITTSRIVLDQVEYDVALPDSLFQMPAVAR